MLGSQLLCQTMCIYVPTKKAIIEFTSQSEHPQKHQALPLHAAAFMKLLDETTPVFPLCCELVPLRLYAVNES